MYGIAPAAWHPTDTVDRSLSARPRTLANTYTLVLADALERVAHARAARDLIADGYRGPAVVLPIWQWTRPNKPVGRKRHLPQPVRLTWTPGAVLAVTSRLPGQLEWHACSLGWDTTGTQPAHLAHPLPNQLPDLHQLAGGETDAIWRILTEFERIVAAAIRDKARSQSNRPDWLALAEIRDGLLYGDNDDSPERTSSKALQLIDKLLDPVWPREVDPLKAATRTLKRDVHDRLAASKNDPRCGTSVRTLASELDLTPPYTAGDVKWLIAVYRQRHPHRALGFDRAWRALHLTDVFTQPLAFSEIGNNQNRTEPFDPADPDSLSTETHRRLTRIA